jgi:hypothetical protein
VTARVLRLARTPEARRVVALNARRGDVERARADLAGAQDVLKRHGGGVNKATARILGLAWMHLTQADSLADVPSWVAAAVDLARTVLLGDFGSAS